MEVKIPYNLTEEKLVLDPSSFGELADDEWDILGEVEEEEMPRVLTATVCLYHALKGEATMNQCLNTAMIWERG